MGAAVRDLAMAASHPDLRNNIPVKCTLATWAWEEDREVRLDPMEWEEDLECHPAPTVSTAIHMDRHLLMLEVLILAVLILAVCTVALACMEAEDLLQAPDEATPLRNVKGLLDQVGIGMDMDAVLLPMPGVAMEDLQERRMKWIKAGLLVALIPMVVAGAIHNNGKEVLMAPLLRVMEGTQICHRKVEECTTRGEALAEEDGVVTTTTDPHHQMDHRHHRPKETPLQLRTTNSVPGARVPPISPPFGVGLDPNLRHHRSPRHPKIVMPVLGSDLLQTWAWPRRVMRHIVWTLLYKGEECL